MKLTNLLPIARRHALVREYYFRLGVVALATISVLVVMAGVLLVPSYLFIQANVAAKQAQLASIESTLSASNETALSARLIALSSDTATLAGLASAPSASASIRALLAVAHPNITLATISYTASTQKTSGTVVVSGTSSTRDALRNYQIALQNTPGVARADLPVSAYAQDADITFTVTVTLSP